MQPRLYREWIRSVSRLTALPICVAHLQVPASAGWVLPGTFGAADVLDLLGKGLQGGVDLNVTVCNGASIICSEVTEWVWAFLALWGCKLEVKSSLRWTRGAGNTRRSRGALKG